MAIHQHSASAAHESKEAEVLADINTTPLIDVMLVLLIMLIITIPIQLHAINLDAAGSTAATARPSIVRLGIAANGEVQWNGTPLADIAALETRLAAVAAQPVAPEVQVRPQRQTPYRVVAAVMSAIQRQGLSKVGLASD